MISKDQDEREKGLAEKPAQQSYPLPPWADSSFSSSACEGSLLNTTLLIKGACTKKWGPTPLRQILSHTHLEKIDSI